jgi:ATP-dependent DNA helicase PIF1
MEAAGTYVAVTAASGIAAAPLKGITLHSCMSINENQDVQDNIKKARWNRPELATLQVIIIDEVSMVSAETMQRVLDIFRAVRTGAVPPLPVFVLVGDFKQLPPVAGTLLLGSPVWRALDPTIILLTDCFRQVRGSVMTCWGWVVLPDTCVLRVCAWVFLQAGQPQFLALLDEAGMGDLSPSSVDLLQARVGVTFADTHDVRPTVLVPRRKDAEETNARELDRLACADVPRRTFKAKVQHLAATGNPDKPYVPVAGCSDTPPPKWSLPPVMQGAEVFVECSPDTWKEVIAMATSCLNAGVFEAAKGAQVVFTANVDPPRIVNGTRGVVTDFATYPIVTLLNGDQVLAAPYVVTRRVAAGAPSPVFRVEFVPLKLAWALTIHSAQGMSLDCAEIDLGRDVFSVGQGYVALSRLRSLEGLALRQFHPASIRADPAVVKWYADMTQDADAGHLEDAHARGDVSHGTHVCL